MISRWRRNVFFILLVALIALVTYIQWICLYTQKGKALVSKIQHYGEVVIPGWEPYRNMQTHLYARPSEDTTVSAGANICNKESPPRILLMICSPIGNFDQRVAIRNTWAFDSYQKFNVSVAFMVGQTKSPELDSRIEKENRLYNDMVVEDFWDTKTNATLKSVMMLKWTVKNCNSAAWLMKADDDVFLNMPNLVKYVDTRMRDLKQVLVGALNAKEAVHRDSSSEKFMPKYMYLYDEYPDYLSGVGYLMSMDVVGRLYDKALITSMVYLEDVFITGLCAEAANIQRKYDFRFYFIHGPHQTFDCGILYQRNLIVHSHDVTPYQMYENFDQFKRCP